MQLQRLREQAFKEQDEQLTIKDRLRCQSNILANCKGKDKSTL